MKKPKLVKVVIDRKKWSRPLKGKKLALNALLIVRANVIGDARWRDDGVNPKIGRMCCLGFACLALGAKPKDIRGVLLPNSVQSVPLPGLKYSAWTYEAADINDDPKLPDKEREQRLKALAKENGFDFRFIN